MSKCTKGKLEVSGKLPYIVAVTAPPYRLSGKTIISRGSETGGQDWPAISNEEREANAAEIVRRWDAFEDGGLVEELRTACKAMMKAWWGTGDCRSMHQLKTDMDSAYDIAETVLAKS